MSVAQQVDRLKLIVRRATESRPWICRLIGHKTVWHAEPYLGWKNVWRDPWLFQSGCCARCRKLRVRKVGPPRFYTKDNKDFMSADLEV